jgi:hypothetical protein
MQREIKSALKYEQNKYSASAEGIKMAAKELDEKIGLKEAN